MKIIRSFKETNFLNTKSSPNQNGGYTYLVIIFLIFLILLAHSSIPLSIGSDQANGFIAWKSYVSGSPFNYIKTPCTNSITSDCYQWLSWWSPGQYTIPGIVSIISNLNIANSTLLVIYIFSISGCLGFYKLFRHFQFTQFEATISILIICSQRYFLLPFTVYNGGEILLFGFSPWAILLFDFWFDRKNFFLLIMLSIIGIFLKLTFFISFLGILLYLNNKNAKSFNIFIYTKNTLNNTSFFIKSTLILAITIAVILINNNLGRGLTPSQVNNFCPTSMDIFIPISAPIVSAFCIDDLLTKFFNFNIPGSGWYSVDGMNFDYPEIFYFSLSMVMLIFLSLIKYKKISIPSNYLNLFFSLFMVHTMLFIYLYTNNASISFESRHFRILGVLFIPLFVRSIIQYRNYKLIISLSILIVSLFSSYGVWGFIHRKQYLASNISKSNFGFSNPEIPNSTIDVLRKLDSPTSKNDKLFYCSSANLALEVENNRVIYYDDDFTPDELINNRKIIGKVNHLYIVIPNKFELNKKASLIKKSFLNYSNFRKVHVDDKYQIIEGK
jgi:hypothetical protein